AGMGVKSQYNGFGLLFSGFFYHPIKQGHVAQMNAVECAGGHNAPLAWWKVWESSVNAHCC
ncbi:hypothetical protein N9H08_00600, partial [bacterium]|nr:hypothetical protein [bacterium]